MTRVPRPPVCLPRRRLLLAGLALAAADGIAAPFRDPLLTPPMATAIAASSPLTGIAVAGPHLVAVGRRGHVIVSDSQGSAWSKADVPLSSDLVALHFPTPRAGWAVGHDGVILQSSDGGRRWRKQADGRSLAATMLAHYEQRAREGQRGMEAWIEQARRWIKEGPIHPLFAVWFKDERIGYVGGAFGLLFRTTDGGEHWEPWLDRIDNPKGLHVYGITGGAGDVLLAGEQGLVALHKEGAERFRSLATPYDGSMFGVAAAATGSGTRWLLYGMRGNAFLSDDRAASWRRLNLSTRGGLTAGGFGPAGEMVLTTQTGECMVSTDGGATFVRLQTAAAMPYFGLAPMTGRRIALVGLAGVRIEPLP